MVIQGWTTIGGSRTDRIKRLGHSSDLLVSDLFTNREIATAMLVVVAIVTLAILAARKPNDIASVIKAVAILYLYPLALFVVHETTSVQMRVFTRARHKRRRSRKPIAIVLRSGLSIRPYQADRIPE